MRLMPQMLTCRKNQLSDKKYSYVAETAAIYNI